MAGKIQKVNWRTSQVRFMDVLGSSNDEVGTPIDIRGATGFLVSTSPSGGVYQTAIVLGKTPDVSVDPTVEAEDGYCHATFKGINEDGDWNEQFQLVLPAESEPLYAPVKKFRVRDNLLVPIP